MGILLVEDMSGGGEPLLIISLSKREEVYRIL